MAEKKRLANIEYLRVIAMAMVVVLHFMTKSGSLPEAGNTAAGYLTSQNILALLLESLCIVAVDAYVLISGYLGADREPRPQKAAAFLLRIWFYSLLIPLVLTVFSCLLYTSLQKTSTTYAPWHILESVDKKYARIKALKIVIEELEKVLK